MRKLLALICLSALSACGTAPTRPNLPPPPAWLMQHPPELVSLRSRISTSVKPPSTTSASLKLKAGSGIGLKSTGFSERANDE